jgi:hypothetical protein
LVNIAATAQSVANAEAGLININEITSSIRTFLTPPTNKFILKPAHFAIITDSATSAPEALTIPYVMHPAIRPNGSPKGIKEECAIIDISA